MKLTLTLLVLAFIAFATGFMAYVGIKQGVVLDKLGRVAARRDDRALLFWTLWSVITLVSIGSLAGLLVIAAFELTR